MTWIMVDIEADGPIPGDYSMICFGAVVVEEFFPDSSLPPSFPNTFYGQLKPISDQWVPEALAVSGFSREETMAFNDPKDTMEQFTEWLAHFSSKKERLLFISDNNGFDWQFINWYFHHFLGKNPFGHSSTNLGSLYKGVVGDMRKNFKHLRKTKHDHHPVNDAKSNAEAFLRIREKHGLKITL